MIIGNKIYHKDKVYSSIEWAKSEISNVPDGTLFLADIREYARGRNGRIWKSYPGQLVITFILKPKISKTDLELRLNQLNMAISLGILEPLKKFGVGLKWPNDFIVQNKKVGGVLFELVWKGDFPEGIIVGFAINVNNVIPETDEIFNIAISLSKICEKNINEEKLFTELLESLNKFYQNWLNYDFDSIFKSWKSNQIYLNKSLKIHKKNGDVISGIFHDVLTNGDLVLETEKSKKEIISFYVVENVLI